MSSSSYLLFSTSSEAGCRYQDNMETKVKLWGKLMSVCWILSPQEVGKEEEGNSELQTGNDSDGQQLSTHNCGGHAHTERAQWVHPHTPTHTHTHPHSMSCDRDEAGGASFIIISKENEKVDKLKWLTVHPAWNWTDSCSVSLELVWKQSETNLRCSFILIGATYLFFVTSFYLCTRL